MALNFKSCIMDTKHTKAEYLQVMLTMIRNLKSVGNNLSDD